MNMGRYYFDRKKWNPAINRFREIIDIYETTIYTEEALHIQVEVHSTIGIIDEAEKYFKIAYDHILFLLSHLTDFTACVPSYLTTPVTWSLHHHCCLGSMAFRGISPLE